MIDKNYFQFYETFYATIETLPIDEQLKYFKAICRYGLFGEQPQFSDKKDLAIFLQIQFAIDNQNKRRVINRENVSKRYEKLRHSTNNYETVQNAEMNRIEMKGNEEKENSDSYESSDFEKSQSLSQSSNSSSKKFVKPTVEEIRAFCAEKNLLNVDAESFIDFYESKGWLVGKSKMKDWRASVRNWNRRNNEESKAAGNYASYPTEFPDYSKREA